MCTGLFIHELYTHADSYYGYLGLILFALGAKGVKQFNENKQAEILANLQTGDLYKAMWDEEANRQPKGALVKVERVSGDTLVIVHTKDMIERIDTYSQGGWDKLSSNPAAFGSKEYKVKLASFISNKNFEEFNTKRHMPFGYVLVGNYAFDAVERK
ncbi:MAG: hypothetical protein J0I41_15040 [Filimonas sp.]|nr:hypothetical protein [Filimonas sp.]